MNNPNDEFWSSLKFFIADEFDDQPFSVASGEPDLSTEEFTEEDFEDLINGPPVNVASHQSGVDASMDMIAQTDNDASTMAFEAFKTTTENNNVDQSNMGTVEVATNAPSPAVLNIIRDMDSHSFSMACMGMLTMESYLGIEVASNNVASTEVVDTIVQTDGNNAPTNAAMEIGETSGLNFASSCNGTFEVASNMVATTEVDTIAQTDVDASTLAIVPYLGTIDASTMAIVPYIGIFDASTMAIVPYIGTEEVINVATTKLGITNGVNDNFAQNSATNNWGKRKISKFSQIHRLQGWTIKINPRPKDPTRADRFFVHVGSGIQFRSRNEVDDFVHFGYHPKRQVNNVNGPVNSRRSIKRNFNWRLYQRGVLPDGTTPIFDISFVEPGAEQISNNIISIEGTISDPETDKACKKRKTTKLLDDRERALAFFYETNRPLKIKDKGDNDEEKDNNDKEKNKYTGKGKGKMYED